MGELERVLETRLGSKLKFTRAGSTNHTILIAKAVKGEELER